ncbi:MAG: type I methionyl aminopeptidase [Bacillota bacterium]
MVTIKSLTEIDAMKASGEILIEVLSILKDSIKAGITTIELDRIAEKHIRSRGAIPSFKGYKMEGAVDFPASICSSLNSEVVHGIPDSRELLNGDIISVDVGVFFNGFHTDAARTWGVGDISIEAQNIIDVARKSFFEGIKFAIQNKRIIDISGAIEDYVHNAGYSVVTDLTGHGIGRALHEDPAVPNFRSRHKGPRLRAGMALAIEPMINMGSSLVKTLENRWTVVTRDGGLSAHYENTIIVTENEPKIITLDGEI